MFRSIVFEYSGAHYACTFTPFQLKDMHLTRATLMVAQNVDLRFDSAMCIVLYAVIFISSGMIVRNPQNV